MKQSLEAAKRRRGVPTPTPTPIPNATQQPQPPGAPPAGVLTIQQAIDNIGKRLITLELFMTETKQTLQTNTERSIQEMTSSEPQATISNNMDEVIDEFDKRYQLLASEVASLKDIVLSLQKYTMDVNKMLLEDRTHIMDELENQEHHRQEIGQTQE